MENDGECKKCFDCEKYLNLQSSKIVERMKQFGNKVYVEFGGKLFDDLHAQRILPGFDPNIQIKLLENMKEQCEIILCVNANDIEKNKLRADFGITYDAEVFRLIDKFRSRGLTVSAIVITLFKDQPAAVKFKNKLENLGERVFCHFYTKGYPTDVETIVSDEGYGKNPYITTTKPMVVITAPGPGSGKLATCLSQLYHEYKAGRKAGYAKFEKFPVWNLALKHPVNLAYEAATADLKDVNMIDSYHFDAYGKIAVNYNRDLELFPVVKEIIKKITGSEIYKSPTDMGINTIADCIFDDDIARKACCQEIIRRYFRAMADFRRGRCDIATVQKTSLLMNELNLIPYDRKCVKPAEEKSEKSGHRAVAIELHNGTIVTGRTTEILSASSSVILNALKTLANLPDKIKLISPQILEPIVNLKKEILGADNDVLSLKEVLIALSVCAKNNEMALAAYEKLKDLAGCEAHSTHILSHNNESVFRGLKINVTCGDKISNRNLIDL